MTDTQIEWIEQEEFTYFDINDDKLILKDLNTILLRSTILKIVEELNEIITEIFEGDQYFYELLNTRNNIVAIVWNSEDNEIFMYDLDDNESIQGLLESVKQEVIELNQI